MADIETPTPITWTSDSLLTQAMLNQEIRDAMRFLVSGCSCTATLANNFSVPNGVSTPIVWDTQLDDTDGIITVPDSTFTFTRDGIIAIRVNATFLGSVGGKKELKVFISGSIVSGTGDCGNVTSSHQGALCHALDVPVLAGDTCVINAFQSSGGALNLLGGQCKAALSWVGKVEDFINFDAPPPDKPDPSPPPTSNPTKHTRTYGAQWSRSYDGDDGTTWDDSPYCYQGFYPGGRGNTKSLVGFDWRGIKNDLRGASRITMELTYFVQHSYAYSGLTTIIGGHNYDNKPGSWANNRVDQNMQRTHADYQRKRTVTLNRDLTQGFKSGQYKGIAFGPGPSTSVSYYGFFNGANMSNEPRLNLTYWK